MRDVKSCTMDPIWSLSSTAFETYIQHEESSAFVGESSEKKNATDAQDINTQGACQRVKHYARQLKTHAGKRNKPIPTTDRSSGMLRTHFPRGHFLGMDIKFAINQAAKNKDTMANY